MRVSWSNEDPTLMLLCALPGAVHATGQGRLWLCREVRKVIWDEPMSEATPKLEAAASKAAADVSLRSISTALAPKFGAAARTALETGVREATKKAMGSWKPSWSGGSTSLDAAGGLENDQSTASWDWGA